MGKKWYNKSLKEIFDTEDYHGETLIDKIARIFFTIVLPIGAITSYIILIFWLIFYT